MQDFPQQLADQVAFLESSAERFDAGEEREAKRLATTLRVLLHTPAGGGRSVALLEHLGVRDTLPWTDSARGPSDGLTWVAMDAGLWQCAVHD